MCKGYKMSQGATCDKNRGDVRLNEIDLGKSKKTKGLVAVSKRFCPWCRSELF